MASPATWACALLLLPMAGCVDAIEEIQECGPRGEWCIEQCDDCLCDGCGRCWDCPSPPAPPPRPPDCPDVIEAQADSDPMAYSCTMPVPVPPMPPPLVGEFTTLDVTECTTDCSDASLAFGGDGVLLVATQGQLFRSDRGGPFGEVELPATPETTGSVVEEATVDIASDGTLAWTLALRDDTFAELPTKVVVMLLAADARWDALPLDVPGARSPRLALGEEGRMVLAFLTPVGLWVVEGTPAGWGAPALVLADPLAEITLGEPVLLSDGEVAIPLHARTAGVQTLSPSMAVGRETTWTLVAGPEPMVEAPALAATRDGLVAAWRSAGGAVRVSPWRAGFWDGYMEWGYAASAPGIAVQGRAWTLGWIEEEARTSVTIVRGAGHPAGVATAAAAADVGTFGFAQLEGRAAAMWWAGDVLRVGVERR